MAKKGVPVSISSTDADLAVKHVPQSHAVVHCSALNKSALKSAAPPEDSFTSQKH